MLEQNEIIPVLLDDDVVAEIYNRLLVKEKWKQQDGSLVRLKNYVAALAIKAEKEMTYGGKSDILVNRKRDQIVLNSALFNEYGQDILLVFQISQKGKVQSPSILKTRYELLNRNFSVNDCKAELKPLVFYNSAKELILEISERDLDLANEQRLYHVLKERIERFPQSIADLPLESIYSRLREAVSFGLKMCKRDFRYAVPMYNLRRGRIQWLLPFRVGTRIGELPELAVIIDKPRAFAEIKTIISIEDAFVNARLLACPDSDWLSLWS